MTTVVSVAQGGTGSNSAALARTALGVPPSAAYDQANTARTQANTAYSQANSAYSDANTRLSASGGTLAGDLIITGNLTVSGNSTTLNAEILTIEDADIVLLSNVASTPALNAGIIVNRGTSTNTFLRWDEVTDKWGWSDDGSTTYKFTSALDAYAQANSAYGAANNRVLKAGDTMTGQLNISAGGLLVTGNVGIGTSSPFSKLQVGANTFSGGNGTFSNDRVGLGVHGSLTSIMYASTYNDGTYPDYGLVFVHGSNTSNYNVWSLSPDGPAKGNSLNFIYGSNATNIHTGTPKVVFRGDGNVGIGTASPASKLTVSGDVQILSTNYLNFTNTAQQTYIRAPASNTIAFGTSSTEQMRLDSSGNLGIGTSTVPARLTILGPIGSLNDAAGTMRLVTDYSTSGSADAIGAGIVFAQRYFNSEATTIRTGGIYGLKTEANGNFGGGLAFYTQPGSSADMAERMRITHGGNLGIGTTTAPTSGGFTDSRVLIKQAANGVTGGALQIEESGSDSVAFFGFTGSAFRIGTSYRSTGSYYPIQFTPAGVTPSLHLATDGNVGIGTTSPGSYLSGTAKLVAYANANAQNSILVRNDSSGVLASSAIALNAYGNVWGIEIGSTAKNNNALTFQLDYGGTNSEKMRLDSSGNLGIGATAPQSKLEVATSSGQFAHFGATSTANGEFTGITLGYRENNSFYRKAAIVQEQIGDNSARGHLHLLVDIANDSGTVILGDSKLMIHGTTGNVGIGTTSPSNAQLVVKAASAYTANTYFAARLQAANYADTGGYTTMLGFGVEPGGWSKGAIGYTRTGGYDTGHLAFYVNGTIDSSMVALADERARITAAGDLCVGTTAAISSYARIHVRGDNKGIAIQDSTDNSYRAIYNQSGLLYFYNGTNEGYLSSAGAWVDASDARLKENIVTIKHGLDSVMKSQPRSYKMKDGDAEYVGFIAQEMLDVIPECVSGKPEKQLGISYGSLVAVAFKAIQEQQAIITTLTARITALESK